jgi:hypothetical protein
MGIFIDRNLQRRLDQLSAQIDKPGWLVKTPGPAATLAAANVVIGGINIPPLPPVGGVIVDTDGLIYEILYAIIGLGQQIQSQQGTLANQTAALKQLQTIATTQSNNQAIITQLFGAVEATLASVLQRVPADLAGNVASANATLTTLISKTGAIMALKDDIDAAFANMDTAIQAVAADIAKYAADVAAAMANNDTAAAQAALDGITSRAATLQGIVTANPAP